MSKTMSIDCVKQPEDFYLSLTKARELRQRTHAATVALQETIAKYGAEVDSFAGQIEADKK